MIVPYWISLLSQLGVIVLLFKQHNKSSDIKRIVLLLLTCVLFHVVTIVLEVGIPFGLLYGPLIRKAYFKRNGLEQKINSRITNLNLLPFYIFATAYSVLCILHLIKLADTYTWLAKFYHIGYLCGMTLSLFLYPLSILLTRIKENFELYEVEDRVLDILVFLALASSFPLLLFIINMFGHRNWGFRLDVMMYSILLLSVIVLIYYLFIARALKQGLPDVREQLIMPSHTIESSNRFPLISNSKNVQKIYDRLKEDELYLKPNISLDILAEKMGLPKHICSKLLNEEIGKSFYQLIAEYRIEHAIKLMESDESKRYTIEWLAHASGFSSKTSFNRYFKAYKGCVPSQYKKK